MHEVTKKCNLGEKISPVKKSESDKEKSSHIKNKTKNSLIKDGNVQQLILANCFATSNPASSLLYTFTLISYSHSSVISDQCFRTLMKNGNAHYYNIETCFTILNLFL